MDEELAIAMRSEWESWNNLSKDLRRIGFDGWDDPKLATLHASVVLWGESLAAIRLRQEPDMHMKAFNEALEKYRGVLEASGIPLNQDEYEAPF